MRGFLLGWERVERGIRRGDLAAPLLEGYKTTRFVFA